MPIKQGLACCPICGDYVRMALEDKVLVIYHACEHYRDAWSEENRVTATFLE